MSLLESFVNYGVEPDRVAWLCGDASKIRETLSKRPWKSLWLLLKVLDSVLRGIAQVCFANNPASGLLILLGLFIGDYLAGAGAVVCSLVAIVTAKFLQHSDGDISDGLTNFSAVLVGTVTTSLYPVFFHQPFTGELWAYMIASAVFCVCIGTGLGALLSKHNLPGYTLPFNIATSITFLCLRARGYGATSSHDDLTETTTNVEDTIEWQKVWLGSLLTAGQVYAVESIPCSALVIAGLLMCSPIIAIATYIGGLVATLTALAVSSPPYSSIYAGVWGYNGFLSAGCLAFFMVPTPRIILLAAVNSAFTTFLQAAIIPVFSVNKLPIFTFPFCLSSLLFLALATNAGLGSSRVPNPTFPEQHLATHLLRLSPPCCASSPSSSSSSGNVQEIV